MNEGLTPPYAHFIGNMMEAPQVRMINANMYGFFIKGDSGKIQDFIDSTIGLHPEAGSHFKVLSSYCMLTFTDIENVKSTNPQFSNMGWFQESDIIIWLPVAKMEDDKINHIYWYPAFICVNNILALINGRETWGFNKYLCDLQMPAIGGKPDFFNITVDSFKEYHPDTKLSPHELFNVKLVQEDKESPIENFVDLVKEGIELLKTEADFFDLDFDAVKQMAEGFIHPEIDQLLFKQFPDGQAENAVYQNTLHSPSVVDKIHNACIYFHEFEFTLEANDMFPLDKMFGIPLGSQRPLLPFNVLFDFHQEAALDLSDD